MTLFFLLLQHVDKPANIAIASDSGGGAAALVQTGIAALVSALAGYLFRSLFTRPAEKAEQYEEAKLKAIADNLAEHKTTYQANLREWQTWREHIAERTTKLELQTENHARQLSEKVAKLGEEVTETKEMAQDIKETLAGMKVRMEQTFDKWIK
ncbi:hypothetical protein [Spirosoma agri]|uniref:Uncharacterized protein n=1 Tax=Spirosoma agri TaxID=1987381 RepID=A0A6M0IKD3_9BACT|nr:hypothetical protein [Spirosoma agri]NEU68292.1 hypothetical protein [Spirosoma agri]